MTLGPVTTLVTCNDCGISHPVPINRHILHGHPPDGRSYVRQVHDWLHANGWDVLNVGNWTTTGPKYEHYCPSCSTVRRRVRLQAELASLEALGQALERSPHRSDIEVQ